MNALFIKLELDELVNQFNAAMALAIAGQPLLANDCLFLVDDQIYKIHTHLGFIHPKLTEAKNVTYDN